MKRALCIAPLTALLAVVPALASIPTQPGGETVPPTDIATGAAEPSETSAVVLGYFNYGNTQPVGIAKDCWFDYGTTPSFGSRAAAVCAGTTKATLAPLVPGTLYYYRAGASNAAGASYAPTTKTFTTLGSAPPPGTPPPANTGAKLRVVPGQSFASVRRRGLRLRVTLPGPCPCVIRGKLLVSRSTAKRLGIGSSTSIAQSRRKHGAPGTDKITLRLKSAVKRELRRMRVLKATASVGVTDASGRPTVLSRPLLLKRTAGGQRPVRH